MKCKHSEKHLKGYVWCQKYNSVRKEECKHQCHKFEPTFWGKLKYLIVYGQHWRG